MTADTGTYFGTAIVTFLMVVTFFILILAFLYVIYGKREAAATPTTKAKTKGSNQLTMLSQPNEY